MHFFHAKVTPWTENMAFHLFVLNSICITRIVDSINDFLVFEHRNISFSSESSEFQFMLTINISQENYYFLAFVSSFVPLTSFDFKRKQISSITDCNMQYSTINPSTLQPFPGYP